jgi:hypothetical protein
MAQPATALCPRGSAPHPFEGVGRVRATFITAYVRNATGRSGADAFTIMKLMWHSTITISQRYVHPSPESVELISERLTALNLKGPLQFPLPVAGSKRETVTQVV